MKRCHFNCAVALCTINPPPFSHITVAFWQGLAQPALPLPSSVAFMNDATLLVSENEKVQDISSQYNSKPFILYCVVYHHLPVCACHEGLPRLFIRSSMIPLDVSLHRPAGRLERWSMVHFLRC